MTALVPRFELCLLRHRLSLLGRRWSRHTPEDRPPYHRASQEWHSIDLSVSWCSSSRQLWSRTEAPARSSSPSPRPIPPSAAALPLSQPARIPLLEPQDPFR